MWKLSALNEVEQTLFSHHIDQVGLTNKSYVISYYMGSVQ